MISLLTYFLPEFNALPFMDGGAGSQSYHDPCRGETSETLGWFHARLLSRQVIMEVLRDVTT